MRRRAITRSPRLRLTTPTSAVVNVRITSTNALPLVAIAAPIGDATFEAPANISITASATDSDGTVSRVEFYSGATKLGESFLAPYTLTWSNVPMGNYTLTAVAFDNSGASTVSAPVNISVITPPLLFTNTLVSTGVVWKYLDDGSDQGTNWVQLNFDDGAWASGPAQFGYSSNPPENDEATIVSFGPSDTDKYITTYFRHRFRMNSTEPHTNLTVRFLRDDGAVVYLNGIEVFRSNMPTGTVTSTTFAAGTANDDGMTWFTSNASPGLLVTGTNVVAVEIHQVNRASSDISFDLEMIGRGTASGTNATTLQATVSAGGVFRLWFAASAGSTFVIEASSDFQIWTPVYTNSAVNRQFEFTENVGGNWRFYRTRR